MLDKKYGAVITVLTSLIQKSGALQKSRLASSDQECRSLKKSIQQRWP
jgi:hypothetical protein